MQKHTKDHEEDLADILHELMILDNPDTQYVISGSGWGWYLDPDTHEFVRVSRGTQIIPMMDQQDDRERVLVKSLYRFLLIPIAEVQEVGWN